MTREPRSIPEMSRDSQIIEELLRGKKVDEVATWDELSKSILRDVRKGARHIVAGARRRLLREHIVFGTVVREGLKRLDDVGAVTSGVGRMAHVRRTAHRAILEITSVKDFDALPPEIQAKHNLTLGAFGVIAHMTKKRAMQRLSQGAAAKERGGLPLVKMLNAVAESIK